MDVGRELDFDNPEDDRISSDPHVALWKSGPPPSEVWPEEFEPGQDWYVSVDWFSSEGFMSGGKGGQIEVIEGYLHYSEASILAIKWSIKLGIPAIEQGLKLISMPGEQTEKQKSMVLKIMETGEIE